MQTNISFTLSRYLKEGKDIYVERKEIPISLHSHCMYESAVNSSLARKNLYTEMDGADSTVKGILKYDNLTWGFKESDFVNFFKQTPYSAPIKKIFKPEALKEILELGEWEKYEKRAICPLINRENGSIVPFPLLPFIFKSFPAELKIINNSVDMWSQLLTSLTEIESSFVDKTFHQSYRTQFTANYIRSEREKESAITNYMEIKSTARAILKSTQKVIQKFQPMHHEIQELQRELQETKESLSAAKDEIKNLKRKVTEIDSSSNPHDSPSSSSSDDQIAKKKKVANTNTERDFSSVIRNIDSFLQKAFHSDSEVEEENETRDDPLEDSN